MEARKPESVSEGKEVCKTEEGEGKTAHETRNWRGWKDAREGRREMGDGRRWGVRGSAEVKCIKKNATRHPVIFVC